MGCCFFNFVERSDEEKAQALVNEFLKLVLGTSLDPVAVHREFWKIRRWRDLEIDLTSGHAWATFLNNGRCSPHATEGTEI